MSFLRNDSNSFSSDSGGELAIFHRNAAAGGGVGLGLPGCESSERCGDQHMVVERLAAQISRSRHLAELQSGLCTGQPRRVLEPLEVVLGGGMAPPGGLDIWLSAAGI